MARILQSLGNLNRIIAAMCVLLVAAQAASVYAEDRPPSTRPAHAYLPFVSSIPTRCESGPCLLTPADGSSVDTLLPTFTWDAGSANAVSRLHICATDQVPCGSCYPSCPTIAGPGIHSVLPAENLPARKVWWAIELQYQDEAGQPVIKFSPVRSLQVIGEPLVPQAPALIGPSGTVTNTTVTFQWQPVAGALDYKLCYSSAKGWSCVTTEATELKLTLPAYEQRYVWWAEARNYYGYSNHEQLIVVVKPSAAGSLLKSARE